ncbi:hypothetical protein QJS10_CPA10g00311 [Acorus calamus]|uniref:FAD synthase n=1 Tax=Acorus calamus TaxID=4465 RepID=A0AAV9E2V3_ACOCL|nr:hypothetical protein QJS10_CPA10g00311 [Acorus calamus]
MESGCGSGGLIMKGVGGGLLLRSRTRTSPPSIFSSWTNRSVPHHQQHQRFMSSSFTADNALPPPLPLSTLLGDRFSSIVGLKQKGNFIKRKVLKRCQTITRVCNLCGPHDAKLGNTQVKEDGFLIDCSSDQECVVGGIVALGKFESLHVGHRELAIQASKAGSPFLLSFVGMAEVLGWEPRAPLVAKCDRKRVLTSWAPYCGNVVPVEFHVEFSNVRHLTPRQFVERLSKELRVSGVVAGENYRFGYKASGDASELVRLCNEYGLAAYIVSSVMDKAQCFCNGPSGNNSLKERGQVSSTRVRKALALGDVKYVSELLGRNHRLVLMVNEELHWTSNSISAPKLCMLNQSPKDGLYDNCTLLVDNMTVGLCRVSIRATHIHIELGEGALSDDLFQGHEYVGIEFGLYS